MKKRNLCVILGLLALSVTNGVISQAQIISGNGVNSLTLTYEGHGNNNVSPLSVSATNALTSAAPFVFADINSSSYTYPSSNSPYISLTMSGNHVTFHTGGVTLIPISFQIPLANVDNGNGAYVRFNANVPYNTTGVLYYDYIDVRKSGNGRYYYKVNN